MNNVGLTSFYKSPLEWKKSFPPLELGGSRLLPGPPPPPVDAPVFAGDTGKIIKHWQATETFILKSTGDIALS
jgi:hypothetical protein